MIKYMTKQWVILGALVIWGMMSFVLLAGEPAEGTSLGKFFLIKVLALISSGACIWVGKVLNSKGLLPNVEE